MKSRASTFPLVIGLLSAALVLVVACADDSDTGWPATFGDYCYGAPDYCRAPFSCLNIGGGTETSRCTKACTKKEDCPEWHSTGHCSGDFSSECLEEEGICQPITCK